VARKKESAGKPLDSLASKLVKVPKGELNREIQKDRKRKQRRKKK
jgi:hypothetical protein